jgi:glycosyltransferase involved in cell wall biosynthesis
LKPDSISFVLPCLNEERTLGLVLAEIRRAAQSSLKDWKIEVLVVDNGSTDGSASLASSLGARVVPCASRGYGAALRQGVLASRSRYVITGDADGTYDFSESASLLAKLAQGFDLVLGSRLKGDLPPGAMPSLHRRLGTPLLSLLIRALHGGWQGLSDCNSGFRCFERERFLQWNLRSQGMELASEMLVKAFRKGAKLAEVPVSFRPGLPGRKPHLRPFRDGLRHFHCILFPAA